MSNELTSGDESSEVRLIIRRVWTQQTSDSTWREETTCETVVVNVPKLKKALTKQGVVELVGYEIVSTG